MLGPDTVAGSHLSKTLPAKEEVQRSMAPKASERVREQRKISPQHYNVGTNWFVHKTLHRAITVQTNDPEERR